MTHLIVINLQYLSYYYLCLYMTLFIQNELTLCKQIIILKTFVHRLVPNSLTADERFLHMFYINSKANASELLENLEES